MNLVEVQIVLDDFFLKQGQPSGRIKGAKNAGGAKPFYLQMKSETTHHIPQLRFLASILFGLRGRTLDLIDFVVLNW